MKKAAILIIAALLVLPAFGDYSGKSWNLLSAAISVNATVTKTRAGGDFTSAGVAIGDAKVIAITTTFARAAGSASTIDVEFEISYDSGASWAILRQTAATALIQVATNTTAQASTTVAVTTLINVYGFSHIRVRSVYNSDGANNITAFQVYLTKSKG